MTLMLSTTAAERENILSAALFFEDRPGAFDIVNPGIKDLNPGNIFYPNSCLMMRNKMFA